MNDLEPGRGETLDRLSRTLRLLQRARGHRATSDDVLLAGLAARAAPDAQRILDLGTGKGTVALLLARRLPEAHLIGLEAQPESHALAVRNTRLNDLADRFEPRLADLRDPKALSEEPPFDLICGAPPYMPLGTGPLAGDPTRAAGRFELRGGVEDYAATALAHLAPGGTIVLLMDGRGAPRLERALKLTRLIAILPRPGYPPTFQLGIVAPGPRAPDLTFAMRGPAGDRWSDDYTSLRGELDLDG